MSWICQWSLICFSSFLFPSLILSVDVIFLLYCRDSKVISWGHCPNIQHVAQKRNVARNHTLAKQRWAKDKKLGPAHSLARPPAKSSSAKLTFMKKLDTTKGQPLRSQKISHPEGAHVSMLQLQPHRLHTQGWDREYFRFSIVSAAFCRF